MSLTRKALISTITFGVVMAIGAIALFRHATPLRPMT